MTKQLPKPLLFLLAKDTQQENPIWPLLVANEYLPNDDPLLKAFITKISPHQAKLPSEQQKTFKAACMGKTFNELSQAERSTIGTSTLFSARRTQQRTIYSGRPKTLRNSRTLSYTRERAMKSSESSTFASA